MTDKGAPNDYQTLSEPLDGSDSISVATFGIEESKPSKVGLGLFTWGIIALGLFLATASIIIGVTYYYEHQTSTSQQQSYANLWRDRSIYFAMTDRFACNENDMTDCTPCTQLRSYCGGKFDGIRQKLDYITEMGFDAIWISPIPDNSDDPDAGPGYHGYYAHDLHLINQHFGDHQSLKALIKEAHDRGLLVMADVVANHAGPSTMPPFPLSSFNPFNQPEHYHPGCDEEQTMGTWASPGDYTYPLYNQTDCEICWLFGSWLNDGGLPDLNTENPYVQQQLKDWVHKTIESYKFDGMRVDTTPYVPKWFWHDFNEAAGVYAMGEITSRNHSYTADYQNSGAMTTLLDYPGYFMFSPIFFSKGSMTGLADLYQLDQTSYNDPYLLGLFVDNHDNPRVMDLAHQDVALVFNSLAYIWFYPGVPILYYGTEQGYHGLDIEFSDIWGNCQTKGGGDPCNRMALWPSGYDRTNQFYQFIKKINLFRKAVSVSKYPLIEVAVGDSYYAYIRGPVLCITTNVGSVASSQTQLQVDVTAAQNALPLDSQLGPGEAHPPAVQWVDTELTNLLDETDKITVPASGVVGVTLVDGQPKIYYPSYLYNQH